MSEENVKASRLVWDRFLAGDRDGVLAHFDPDIEVHDPPELPGATVHHGHAGWVEQIEKFTEAFAGMEYEVLEHIDCGDEVVTVIEASATGAGSGISGAMTYAQLECWQDGKVTSMRYFLSKEAALDAAERGRDAEPG